MTKAVEKDTQQFYARLTRVLGKIHQAKSFADAYPLVERAILALFSAQRLTVYQRNRNSGDIVSRFKTGSDVEEIRVPITASSIAGYVALSKESVAIRDVRDSDELTSIHPSLQFNESFEKDIKFKSRSMLVIPILHNEVLLGVLQIINRRDGKHFSAIDLKRGKQFAELLGQKFRYDFGCTESPYDYLIEQNLITERALEQLKEKVDSRTPITRLLRDQARIPVDELGQSLEYFYQVPFIAYEPEKYFLHPLCETVNKAYLKNSNLVLLAQQNSDLVSILIDDPNDTKRLMEIKNVVGALESQVCVATLDDIHQYLGISALGIQQDGANLSTLLDELGDTPELEVDEQSDSEEVSDEDSTVVRLVNRILLDAKRLRASDVHVEPGKGKVPTNVRMRIDGVCQEIIQIPAAHAKAAVSRIKVMSRLDIAEKRLPQDGKFAVRLQGQSLEVRVATIPTVNGEGVVMRLLQSGEPVPFDDLNLNQGNMQGLGKLLEYPHGILLVVGPTGSGKTTTLHALLAQLNTPEKKIWTAEDPVEITQAGLQQVQIQPKTGFTFAAALRSFLRADPDIILIGEMRDKETAHAAVEASLTGHLVLSTLHTNSAPETITRLLDLDIDPVSFSDALLGILAQRLVRTLCSECRKPYRASGDEIDFLKRQYGETMAEELVIPDKNKLYKAQGCDECNHTGYRGRTGIHELLVSTAELREKIYHGANIAEIREQAQADGMRTLLQDGIMKVLKGEIDLQQLHRVTAE